MSKVQSGVHDLHFHDKIQVLNQDVFEAFLSTFTRYFDEDSIAICFLKNVYIGTIYVRYVDGIYQDCKIDFDNDIIDSIND